MTLSVDEDVLARARQRAEVLGTSVNQLVRAYLEELAGCSDAPAEVSEFERLSLRSGGDSRGWKFNREELHQRG